MEVSQKTKNSTAIFLYLKYIYIYISEKNKTKALIQKDTCTSREKQVLYDITYM